MKRLELDLRTSISFRAETTKNEEEINDELVQRVRSSIGSIASFKIAGAVRALPRTRSGKIVRKSIASLARSKLVEVNLCAIRCEEAMQRAKC